MMNSISEPSYEGRDLEVLADMPNYYAWIMDYFAAHVRGRVIEYGSGSGTVSERILPLADTLTLVEPSTNLVALLHRKFGNSPKVVVRSETLEQHLESLPESAADTVIMVNVLEHIEDDEQALSRLLRALTPGGKLLIFVPALQLLMSRLDLVHGHFRRYHRPDLVGKVASAGGVVELCRYFDLVGVVPWLLLNKLGGSTGFNPALIRVNDTVVVPFAKVMEKIFSPPFGKNLLLIARRP